MKTRLLLATSLGSALAVSVTAEPADFNLDPATPQPGFHWADYDADGSLDVLVLQRGRPARLLANRGAAGFIDVTATAGLDGLVGAKTAAWRDFDNDGHLDLLVIAPTAKSALYRGTAAGAFEPLGPDSGLELAGVRGAEWIDFDADGLSDLRTATAERDELYRNLGAGRFEKAPLGLEPRDDFGMPPQGSLSGACSSAIEDFDNPGVCMNASSVPTLGLLYPISSDWFIDDATGYVGIGNTNPGMSLDVDGMVRSRSGGVQFPDGTVQVTATLQGPKGDKGDKGDTGDTGAQGPKGDKGDTGDTGAQGPKGDKGDTGDTGAQGPKGDKGDKGDTGAQGPKGDKGDQGDPGTPGDSHWDINGSSTYYNDGNVGIGTSSPAARFTVVASSSLGAVTGENLSNGAGVWGHQKATTGIRTGTGGRTDSTAGRGIFGWATAASGNAYGVQGQSDSASGRGIYGRASRTSGTTYGVFGETNSSAGFGGYFIGPSGSQNYFQRSVGIGTTNPANPLSVVGGADLSGRVSIGITGADARLLVRGVTGEDAFRVRVNSSSKIVVKDNGGVAIGSNYPSVPADGMRIRGKLGVADADPGSFALAVNGACAKPGGGLWSTYSDIRLKHSIESLEPGVLEKLLSLNGYTFEYDQETIDAGYAFPGRQVGLIAQEVEEVFPGWVDTDDDGYLYVTERGLTAVLVEALRELRQEKDAELEELREQNEALEARLERIEEALGERLERE